MFLREKMGTQSRWRYKALSLPRGRVPLVFLQRDGCSRWYSFVGPRYFSFLTLTVFDISFHVVNSAFATRDVQLMLSTLL